MNERERKENDMLYERADSVAASLSEHFDAVQILVSKLQSDGSTTIMYVGKGNYYARTGMAREFLENDRAKTIAGNLPRRPE